MVVKIGIVATVTVGRAIMDEFMACHWGNNDNSLSTPNDKAILLWGSNELETLNLTDNTPPITMGGALTALRQVAQSQL